MVEERDVAARAALRKLAAEIHKLKKEQRSQAASSQMHRRSVEGGRPVVVKDRGIVIARLGPGVTVYDPTSADAEGQATAANVTTGGTAALQNVNASTVALQGNDLETWLRSLPLGVFAVADLTGSTIPTADPFPMARIVYTGVDPDRAISIGGRFHLDQGSTQNVWLSTRVFVAMDRTATWTDHDIEVVQLQQNVAGDGSDAMFTFEYPVVFDGSWAGHNANIVLYGHASAGARLEDDGQNRVWLRDEGAAPNIQTYFVSGGPGTGGGGGGSGDDGGDPTGVRRTVTYPAVDSRSFEGNGSKRYGSENYMYQGYWSGHGVQKSWWWVDWEQVWADLQGASVVTFEVFMYASHWYNGAGGTAVLGYVTSSQRDSYDPDGDTVDIARHAGWPNPGGQWVDVTGTQIAEAFRTGQARGIVVGSPDLSRSREFYGYFHGALQGSDESKRPKLRVTYEK